MPTGEHAEGISQQRQQLGVGGPTRDEAIAFFLARGCQCSDTCACTSYRSIHINVPEDAPVLRELFQDVLKPCDTERNSMCMRIMRTGEAVRSNTPCHNYDDDAPAPTQQTPELEQLEAKQQSNDAADDQPQEDMSLTPARIAALQLRTAAEEGDCGKLCELLDGGGASFVDERSEVMNRLIGEEVKVTALIQAAYYDQHAAVELLLEHGANPNLPGSDGYTPLMAAAFGGHLRILRTLLDRDANAIDAVDRGDGGTAFHCACFTGNADCAVELARRGCDMTLRAENGMTGKEMAEELENTTVLAELRSLVVEQLRAKQQPTAQADDTAEEQKKAAKKSAANRKKKDKKKAKKAAEQQLISQLEPEPEAPECPAQQAEAEAEAEGAAAAKAADPDPNGRTQQLQALTTLGVQQWSTEQVLEWVALADLPQETVSAVSTVMVALDLDGEELIHLRVKILQKLLAKHGAQDAESVSKQVIEQRDALLLLPGDSASESASPKSDLSDTLECPLCMELYCDVEPGLRVPRILTSCGHTVCHGCITKMMTRVLAEGNAKPYSCPTCSKVTKVARGKAASLAKNFALAAAAEAL
jgi:ankyrin repeat protein